MVSRRQEIPSSLDLLPLGERFGDKNKARMRARPNVKFSHIKSSIDHGKKEKKIGVLDTSKDQSKLVRRKGENFGRIAPNTLATYITEGRAARELSRKLNDIEILRKGQFPTKRPPAETALPKIILLDLRSQLEYAQSHISNALSFPAEHIQRDQQFAQLGIYRNKPDKMLVVYHDDERHGILQSRIIFEKGFDNIYLLSGGLYSFEQEFPSLMEVKAGAQSAVTQEPDNGFAAGAMVAAHAQKSPCLPVNSLGAAAN